MYHHSCLRKCASLLETVLEGAVLDELLQVRVSADVLLGEEDVGDGALAGDFEEGILEVVTVVCEVRVLETCFYISIWEIIEQK